MPRAAPGIELFVIFAAFPTQARQWNSTPQAETQEYVIIQDARSPNEIVMLFWLAPQMMPPGKANNVARQLLQDYVVLGMVHVDLDYALELNFRYISDISLETFAGDTLNPLSEGSFPPAMKAVLTALKSLYSKALGKMGNGIIWSVYNGKSLQSCANSGGFFVPYSGQNYDFKFPIPGC